MKSSTSSSLADITNQPVASTSSASSSSSSGFLPRASTSARPITFRQTNLAFAPRTSSPPAPSTSSSSSPSIFDDSRTTRTRLSSPNPVTSPLGARRTGDLKDKEQEDGTMEIDDEVDQEDDEDEAESRLIKRRRLGPAGASSVVDDDEERGNLVAQWRLQPGGPPKVSSLYNVPGRQMNVLQAANRRALGLRAGAAQVSMRPLLRDMVSSNELQVFKCASDHPYRNFAPPFALAFSKAAKAGGKQTCAVADEEGSVSFIDAGQDSQWDAERTRTRFEAHQNAVFDVAWSHDDQLMATASGDQTVKLWDVESQTCVGVLSGHTCTIKNVVWDPRNPSLLSTASRDGSIRVWDRRARNADSNSVSTVNMIKNAHGTKGKVSKGRSATKSVTAVTYLPQSDNLLASSGSADSVIKVWDLRKSHSRRVNPAHVETNEEAVSNTASARPHGISSLVLAPNGQKLYALSTDSIIYAFDPFNLSHSYPLSTFSHPKASYGSFYLRAAISPCSRYLASGSSEAGVYLWDTEGKRDDGVRLVGHEKETSGLDWGRDKLASCSDDGLVRVWGFNSKIARARRAGEEKEIGWRWSGEDEDA